MALAVLLPCCVRAAPGNDTSDAKELFAQGQRALAAANYAEAEHDFDRVLEMGFRSAPVYTNLGVVYLRTGRLDSAISVLKKAKELAPGMTGIDLNLGLAYYRQREYQQAESYFATVVAADAANVQARYLKGECHFMMDEFDAAIAALSPIQDAEQNDLEYLFMLGISLGKVKRPAEAQRTFARLIDAGGETPHLHLLLGKAYLALENYQKARTELEKSAADSSKLPYAHYYLGVLYEKLGKFDAAASEFLEETKMSPNDHWAYEDFTRIRLDQGNPDAAIALLEKAVARITDSASLRAALAKAHMQKSEPERAIPYLKSAIELEPNNGNYHYQLGRAYTQAGRRQEGKAEIAKARALQVEVLKGQMELLSRDGSEAARH